MNERFKLLSDEAHEFALKTIEYGENFGDIWIEKFGKLIVQECTEQSMLIGRYNTPSGITPDLAIAIAVGLKRHFGVKE
jgi:hypothetical protein